MAIFGNILKGIEGTLTHPWRGWDPIGNTLHIVGGPKKSFSDKPYLNLLNDYEQRDAAAQGNIFSSYQQGENAALAKNKAAGQSAVAGTDQGLIGSGLYNTTTRNVQENKARAGEDAGRLAIAGGRAALLDSTRPDPGVYGPLLQQVYAAPGGPTPEARQLIDQMNASDKAATDAATAAYTGPTESASTRLRQSVADESKGTYSALGNVGNATAGRLAQSRGRVGQASIVGASTATEAAKRPQPGLYGPLIAQLANTPVQQSQIRQALGAVAPAAGAVAGGFFGGPAGAVAGGAIGGYAGSQFGAPSYSGFGGNGASGTLNGIATGANMAGKFVRTNADGSPNYFGAFGGSGAATASKGYGDYYSQPARDLGESNYGGSRSYGGGQYIT